LAGHIQTLIRTLKLKKQWKRRAPLTEIQAALQETWSAFESASSAKSLSQADSADTLPASGTENTARLWLKDRNENCLNASIVRNRGQACDFAIVSLQRTNEGINEQSVMESRLRWNGLTREAGRVRSAD